ncbi:RtcB family protein [bacterium]|nr:RtcB family protein [bacterium]
MEWVNSNYRLPIKSWCRDIEEEAMTQAGNLSEHPRTFHHVALMPDCHVGYGMPIGGVIACSDAVIPNAVGVDIGCGMCAVKTTYNTSEVSERAVKDIIYKLRSIIPVGFLHHKKGQSWPGFNQAPDIPVIRRELESAKRQLGTLGGGNHFIEIQSGSDGFIWLMLHSGSRNFGYKVAKEYNAVAQRICNREHFNGQKDLSFLSIGTRGAEEYIEAMKYALAFAQENRRLMMAHFKAAAREILHCGFDEEINIHHNFAAMETHFGRSVWIHRKGATQAKKGQMGIIPGSMGTTSYIVRGLGNSESFMSCSHGAGRCMSRTKFNRIHSVEECNKAMHGIVYAQWSKDRRDNIDLSEAPQAYKDIDAVIESQSDLVEVIVKLRPLGVIKG